MQSKFEPELFFGLVGALGIDLNAIYNSLDVSLKRVGYVSEMITISDSFSEIDGLSNKVNRDSESLRIESCMNVGDELRQKIGGKATAVLAINQIQDSRELKTGDHNKSISSHAYVIRSLKHVNEVQRLRSVYGKRFWLVSAYLPEKTRIESLEKKGVSNAKKLVDRDHYAEKNLGQKVRETFPKGDVFVDASTPEKIQKEIDRFIELIFGHPFHTPDREEYGMFHALASSLRSSSLSRQVGAAIMDKNGNLISTGTNEVPKSGGGVYTEGDTNDHREFTKGYDSNQREKLKMLEDIFERLKSEGWLSKEYNEKNAPDLVSEALGSNRLKNMRFMDLTEYGREVHAEMNALVSAAARGNESVKGCTMYCTTFPCHICAKHIISSGIDTLVFIEPYPKSHASVLFDDSISIGDVDENIKDKVHFKPYFGISPNRYMDFFTMIPRKDKTGNALVWNPLESYPRFWKLHDLIGEDVALGKFMNLMRKNNLRFKIRSK